MAVVTASAGLMGLSPSSGSAAERSAQVAGSLRLSDTTVSPGSEVVLSGKVPPQRARTVKLQTMRDGAWRVLATTESSGRGAFRFTTTAPSQAGDRRYRVLAPATRLGDSRYDAVVTPVRTLTVVAMVATTGGWKHSCALGSDRRAWCWGSNTYGELGDGTGGSSTGEIESGPVRVLGRDWTSLSAMGASTCGIRTDNSGWCWGDGATYLFGDGWVPAPRQLTGDWSQLSAGWFYACGVHTDGSGWCQGQNEDGQLGTDQSVSPTTPVQVAGEWRQIVAGGNGAGNTTCGIKADRTAWCWGSGDAGQLGNGGSTSSSTPVRVTGTQAWASLSVGGGHVCGLTTDGAGWCWGENTDGRLGDGTNIDDRPTPVRVTAAQTWSSLDAGHMHTCGTTPDGTGWCFGRNQAGQLGNGTTETVYFPVPDPTRLPGRWSSVTAGFDHTTGVRPSGRAWAWGAAADGQTGRPSEAVSPLPVEVMVEP